MRNIFRHLTNFSVNKKSKNFCRNVDIEEDMFGHKWSIKALKKKYIEMNINPNKIFD